MKRKVALVTGASGFIGRWSVPPLLAQGFRVHAVVGPHGPRDAAGQLRGADIHAADLLEPQAVSTLIDRVEPSHLLHFAWIAVPGVYWTSEQNDRWLSASLGLLQRFAAKRGSRAVMAGSCAEYDWSQVTVCNEHSSPLASRNANLLPYPACKIALQQSLARFGATAGLSTAWGRIFSLYGPGEHPDRLVPSVISNLMAGREAPCTHGRQIRNFLHVADVGAAFAALLVSGVQGPVNIGSEERHSIATLLGHLSEQLGRNDLLRLGERSANPNEPALLVPDVTRLRREVGWQPRLPLHDGLADTIAWWRARRQTT